MASTGDTSSTTTATRRQRGIADLGAPVGADPFMALLGHRVARRTRRADAGVVPDLTSWTLADRRYGSVMLWFLLGGTIYTAYTFAAVPGLVYGVGALGFFALPYTVMVYPLAFVLLPQLWRVCAAHGYLTVGDYVRGRYGSARLALAVTVTGLLATMPYVALQLLGIRAVLSAGGLYPEGLRGDLALTAVFAILAAATWRTGLHASALIAVAKGTLVFGAVLGVTLAVSARLGGPRRSVLRPRRQPGRS